MCCAPGRGPWSRFLPGAAATAASGVGWQRLWRETSAWLLPEWKNRRQLPRSEDKERSRSIERTPLTFLRPHPQSMVLALVCSWTEKLLPKHPLSWVTQMLDPGWAGWGGGGGGWWGTQTVPLSGVAFKCSLEFSYVSTALLKISRNHDIFFKEI